MLQGVLFVTLRIMQQYCSSHHVKKCHLYCFVHIKYIQTSWKTCCGPTATGPSNCPHHHPIPCWESFCKMHDKQQTVSFLCPDDSAAQYIMKVIIWTLLCGNGTVWASPQFSVSVVRETRSVVLHHVVIHYTAMTTVHEADKGFMN